MQYQKLGCNMSIKILFISILISVVTACGVVIMSCITTIHDTPRLHCIFPEDVPALAVFYTSESGKERVVADCVRLEHFECDTESGFNCTIESAIEAVITPPESLQGESGSFRCQIPGVKTDEANICQWPPVTDFPERTVSQVIYLEVMVMVVMDSRDATNIFLEKGTSNGIFHAPEKIDDYSAEIWGSTSAIAIIVVVLVIVLILFKRFKSQQHRSLSDSLKVALMSAYGRGGPQKRVTMTRIASPRETYVSTYLREYYTDQIILSSEQNRLVNMNVPKLFVAGPPGTGKTVALLLKGIQWLREGHDVHIVSTGWWSIVSCSMLFHLLLQIKIKLQADNVLTGQLHLVKFDFEKDSDRAMVTLSDVMKLGRLYVIADEARPEKYSASKTFWDKMTGDKSDHHIWASSYYIKDIPAGWQAEYLTTPFRFPLTVLKEVEKEKVDYIKPYENLEVSSSKDGPTVKHILHWGHGHTKGRIEDCATCGQETANFLHSLRERCTVNLSAPSTGTTLTNIGTNSSKLKWKDMLVLTSDRACVDSAMVKALRDAKIPVRIMRDDDTEDLATARTDDVWVADGDRVRGIERKVVVVLGVGQENVRLCHMSRCTSQLVIILDSQKDGVKV